MNSKIFSALICAFMLCVAMTLQAQQRFVVSDATGGVEYIVNGHKYPLVKGTPITMETMVYIPYNGSLKYVEDSSDNEYTIKSIGWATLEEKLADNNHTILTRSKDYVKSVLAQVRKDPKVKKPYHSDPATVTREKFENKGDSFSAIIGDYDEFIESIRHQFDEFRNKCLDEYAEFVRETWKEFGVEKPIPVPKEEKVMPVLAPNADAETASWFGDQLKRIFKKKKKNESQQASEKDVTPKSVTPPKPVDKPKPVEKQNVQLAYDSVIKPPQPIEHEPLYEVHQHVKNSNDYMVFDVFGTKCRVRTGDNCRFKLPSVKEDDVADALAIFKEPQFVNMLFDCLQERKKYELSDWGYYQMLLAVTNHFYGENTNEATLALAFLYSQSGYKMRLARDEEKLYMLVASDYMMFDKRPMYIDNRWYWILDGDVKDNLTKLYVTNYSFEKESPLSLRITATQELEDNPTVERTITDKWDEDFSFTIRSNKNYMDFYDTYPSSYIGNNVMTRWAMYANTPLEKGVREQLYPKMKEKLAGLSNVDAVQKMLHWVQTGFEYQYDEIIWGVDRPFFGEESLYYPYCDCEDRAILLSHLVRDLLGLDVVLVHYPGHLAMAVDFKEDVDGVYYLYDNRKFTVCDPTIIDGGSIGQAAYDEGTTTTLFLLDKTNESN